jgi:hypothetical protein
VESDIEACHRLPLSKNVKNKTTPKRTVVRFTNRKNCDSLFRNEKKLYSINLEKIGLQNVKLYINNNLCPYYKLLWSKSKNLYDTNIINRFWVFNGTINVKIGENDTLIHKITHESDITALFPTANFK